MRYIFPYEFQSPNTKFISKCSRWSPGFFFYCDWLDNLSYIELRKSFWKVSDSKIILEWKPQKAGVCRKKWLFINSIFVLTKWESFRWQGGKLALLFCVFKNICLSLKDLFSCAVGRTAYNQNTLVTLFLIRL